MAHGSGRAAFGFDVNGSDLRPVFFFLFFLFLSKIVYVSPDVECQGFQIRYARCHRS